MAVSHQIIDETLVLARPSGAAAIGNPRRLHDLVVAHVIDYADEAVIEHRYRLVQRLFQCRHGGAPCRPGLAALARDLILLLPREPHTFLSSLHSGMPWDCFAPPAALYSQCRATAYGDKRL